MKQQRIQNVIHEMQQQQLPWLALVPSPSFTYLSGIHSHLSERPTILFLSQDGEAAIVLPELEASKARQAGIDDSRIFAWSDQAGYGSAFAAAAAALDLRGAVVGIEALKMRVLEGDLLAGLSSGVVHADHLLDRVRLQKDHEEVAQMTKAVRVAQTAFAAFFPTIRVGMSERRLAAKLTAALLDAGASIPAFEPIVSAGPQNSASPHAVPTDRPLTAGDLLVIDWGARVGDYVSDLTRTFAVGTISEQQHNIYEAVRKANAAGLAACRPGVSGEAIDRAARQEIELAGYGDYFIHRTGHGLGMEAHESPSLVAGATDPLPIGAAFTVEPGVYIDGVGGVRIEDDVVLTADGANVLSSLSRELQTIAADD